VETTSARALAGQLADDLGWLERHCGAAPGHAREAAELRLAAAVVRNSVGPWLDGQPPTPLHVAVVGGAGAGKSTVANLLCGTAAAEANPQAGFTRHPIAYVSGNGPLSWTGHLGFLGPLHRLSEPAPSSLDEDVYQVRRVPPDPVAGELLRDFVVWDCPDMTTWAAGGYVPRLLEAAALADVIVYVASDERYNDEVPTQFLQLLLQSGKPVVACLVKMREGDAPALVNHFRREVLRKLAYPPGGGVVTVLPIPYLSAQELADPARAAARFRVPLLNQVAVLGYPAAAARRRTAAAAVSFLGRRQDGLLGVARQDLDALKSWQAVVDAGRAEMEGRYVREYLDSEKFRGFDEALVRLMELVELPGLGKMLSGTLWVLRTPYRLLKWGIGQAVARPEGAGRPERQVLDEALAGWVDLLRKEAARRAPEHPLWAHVAQGFHADLADRTRERYGQGCRAFQAGQAAEVDRTARSIYERLQQQPGKLNALRGLKLGSDAFCIGVAVATGGINWFDLILVPLAASVSHQLAELVGRQVVDSHREQTRERQKTLLREHLTGPLAGWLTEWPATGGSSFERLRLALRRIPEAIRELESRVVSRQ
jgi:hypothetical protein